MPAFSSVVLLFGTMSRRIDALSWRHLPGEIFLSFDPTFEIAATILEARVEFTSEKGRIDFSSSEGLFVDGTMIRGCSQCVRSALSPLRYATNGDDGTVSIRVDSIDALTGESVYRKSVDVPVRDLTEHSVRRIEDVPESVDDTLVVLEAPDSFTMPPRDRRTSLSAIFSASPPSVKSSMLVVGIDIETTRGMLQANLHKMPTAHLLDGTSPTGRLRFVSSAKDLNALLGAITYDTEQAFNDTLTLLLNNTDHSTVEKVVQILGTRNDDGRDVVDEETAELVAKMQYMETTEDVPLSLSGALKIYGKGSGIENSSNRHDLVLSIVGGDGKIRDRTSQAAESTLVFLQKSVIALGRVLDFLEYHPAKDASGLEYLVASLDDAEEVKIGLLTTPTNDPILIDAPTEINATKSLTSNILPPVYITDVDAPEMAFDVTLSTKFGHLTIAPKSAADGIAMLNSTSNTLVMRGSLRRINKALAALHYTTARNSSRDDNLRILVRENLRTNDTTIFVIVRQSNEPTQPRTLNVVSYRSHHCIEDRRCSLTGISVEIEDPAFEALLVTTTLDVYHGKLILPDKFGRDANFIRIDGALSKQVTFRTTLLECRAALQNLVYEPDSNWHGPDKLCITTSFQGTNTNSTSCINIFVENEVDPPVLNVSSLTMSLDEDDDDTSIELSRIVSVVDPDDIGVFVTTDELFRIDLSARFGRLVTDYISTSGVSTTWNGVSLERETSIGMVGSVDRINRALQSTFYESSVPARREDIIDFNLYRVSLDLHQSLLRLGCNTTARSIITNPNPSNSAPTVTAVDGNYEAWLHVQNTTRVLYLPAVTILDAEAVEFGQVLDVTISSRHGEFRIRSRGRLANVSTQRSSLTFQAFPEDATIAIPNVAYVPFTHFCGFDFVDIIVSDRGADGDGRGSPKTSKLRLNIRVDDVNHQPHIEVPATQTAFGKQAAVSLQGIVLSDVDETLEGTCGNANLQLSISADEGTIQISDFSSAILNPSHAGRLFEAKGTPSALTKLLRTLTLQDLSIGDHRVNVTLQDGSGAIDFKSFPVRVHRLPPISASVQIAQDIPVLLNEDEKLPLKSLLSVHSELPFDFAVTAAPGKLFFQTNASRVELGELSLSGTQTEIIAMLDSIEYVPPKNFNGIARLDASTRESTATLFVQILPLNDPPEIDSISLASGMVQGDVVYLMNAIQLRDSDADDILFANLSVSSGALIADMKSPGVKFTFDSSWVEIVGADDSVSKALSTLTYDATMTGFGTLTIIVRDRMGSNVSETLEYYVEEPSMSAVLSMRAGHLDGFAEVDEDSIFNSLGTFLEVKQVCISKAMLSLRLQTTHGNVSLVPSVWTALDCATSFEEMRCSQIANFSVWSDELGRSILIVHGTADAISRALEEKLAYVPPPDFTGVDTIIATLTSVRSPTECMSEAVRIYVKPVADKPILTFNNSFSIKYEDRPVRLDISVQDSDEEDLLNFLAYARYGNLAYGSRRARKKSVRYYDKVETRIFSNCWTPPSIAGHLEAFSFVQFASTAEEISSISAELNYFPHPEHNFDRISTFVVDSFQLCSNRTADVKVYADQAMLSVTTVSHHDGALLSILEDAPRTKVPALKIIAEGMVASTPSIVNVTVESKFGDISLNSDMNMSQVRIWSRNQTSIGFVARLVDANLALKQFFYKPRLHFFGRWEAYDESSLLDEYDTRKSTEFDVRNACRKRELDRKPLRESISVHVAPITKRGVTDDSSWASSQWRVSVSPVNDAPIIMFDTHALDLPRASARSWHRVAAMANVSLHDSDAGFLEMTVMTLHGDIKLIRPKQIKILENSAKRLTIRGSVNALNVILDNALFYAVPEANTLDAEDTLHFKVQDLGGCGLGPKYERDFELSLKVSSPLISLESKIATERIKVAEDELLALPPVLLSVRGQRYFSDTASVHMESTTSLSFEENVSLTSYARRDREENSNSAFVRDVVQLQGSATHANLAIPEDIPGIEILEPAKMLKLSVLTINENASDYGQDEVWSISTHVPWTRCVQRLAIFLVDDKSSLDQVSKSLSVTSFKIAMTHRNRSSAAELTIGKNRADAKKNVIDALESLSNVGAVSVSIEHFGVETPSATSQSSSATAVAVFLITFSQNDPVPPLDVLITTCGPSVGDGTLKYGEDVKSNCSATISQIQEASTVPETQRVSIRSNGTMKSGQFSIVVDDIPSSGKIRTTLLPFNATADDIRHALESLPSVGLVDVVRSRFNHPMELENDCWCEQCSNAWRVHSSLQNETSLLPNQT